MEFREELEEVTSEKELQPLKERSDGKHKVIIYKHITSLLTRKLKIEKYQEIVNKLTIAIDEKKDFNLAKDLAIELQYWSSISSAIHEWHP